MGTLSSLHSLYPVQYVRSFQGLSPIAFISVGYLFFLIYFLGKTRRLKHIPAAGIDSPIFSYIYAFKFLVNSPSVLSSALAKIKGSKKIVKVPDLLYWLVVVAGSNHIEELRKAPDDVLSMMAATDEALQVEFTLGKSVSEDPYHIPIVGGQMKKAIPQLVPVVHDEIVAAFDELIDPPGTEWKSYIALENVMKVVCRASNRVFVGLPICRDPRFINLNVQFTVDVIKIGTILRMLPHFLRPFVNRLLSSVPARVKEAMTYIEPLIEFRRAQMELLGDDFEKPLDLLTWLMDDAKGEEQSARLLTIRILTLNFAAIHTSSMTFTQALYYLAAFPQYIAPLRDEVENSVKRKGWTKAALDEMVQLDSFIKESQRLHPMGNVIMNRRAKKDYKFSDGTFIPEGTTLGADVFGAHLDSKVYQNPSEFDPLRFVKLMNKSGKKQDIVITNPEFLAFGHGRHACPGRYFASVEMKLMLAHLIVSYDMKMERQGERPPDLWIGTTCLPNTKGEVMFRRRKLAQ